MCAGGADDDLRLERGHADLNAGVAVLSKLAGEHLVELGEEDAIGNELCSTQSGRGEHSFRFAEPGDAFPARGEASRAQPLRRRIAQLRFPALLYIALIA